MKISIQGSAEDVSDGEASAAPPAVAAVDAPAALPAPAPAPAPALAAVAAPVAVAPVVAPVAAVTTATENTDQPAATPPAAAAATPGGAPAPQDNLAAYQAFAAKLAELVALCPASATVCKTFALQTCFGCTTAVCVNLPCHFMDLTLPRDHVGRGSVIEASGGETGRAGAAGASCDGDRSGGRRWMPRDVDTVYTRDAAMD